MEDVEKTHQGLGRAIGMAVVCIKARQCLLMIAPSGCGKSVITDVIAANHPNPVKLLSITKARLTSYKDTFSNFF